MPRCALDGISTPDHQPLKPWATGRPTKRNPYGTGYGLITTDERCHLNVNVFSDGKTHRLHGHSGKTLETLQLPTITCIGYALFVNHQSQSKNPLPSCSLDIDDHYHQA